MRYCLTKYNWNIRPCTVCRRLLDFNHFDLDKRSYNGIKSSCKKCCRDYMSTHYKNNKNNVKDKNLFQVYGITLKEYNTLLKTQNNVCAICKKENLPNSGSLAVDHDHETGKVRGLLCVQCNRGLGIFYDNISYLENAIKYLKI